MARNAAADGAYDTRLYLDELRRKKISALIPARKGADYWPEEYADRNRADCLKIQPATGTLTRSLIYSTKSLPADATDEIEQQSAVHRYGEERKVTQTFL